MVQESFGGPEVLEVREVPEPHAGPGEVRVRVSAAGLNPVDWIIGSSAQAADMFGVSLPSGFGNDFAGTIDEVGEGTVGFTVGDRVFGGARGHAVAEFAVITPEAADLRHTPDDVEDVAAGALHIAGRTADAALSSIGVSQGDTVLIGGAAGGVGVFAVQLARLAGARVIGTASESSFEFLRGLGADPVSYGEGLADRVRALSPDGITAATDLFGTEAAYAAVELGVGPERISTVAAHDPKLLAKATGAADADPGALDRIASLIAAGQLQVPIAATYRLDEIREAVAFQSGRHAHGKVVVTV